MSKDFSRREFLKLSGAALASLAFTTDFPPGRQTRARGLMARVSFDSINVYDAPNFEAETLSYRFRDELLHVYERITSLEGPAFNPLWYRVWGGYIHSANIQEVRLTFNPVVSTLPTAGQLTELSVPYSQAYEFVKNVGWQEKAGYRLYYESIHWVTDVVEGPDGTPWYEITDELWAGLKYHVPAVHLRLIPDDELTSLSPTVAPTDKYLKVSLSDQTLEAYEKEALVFKTKVSTGIQRAQTNNGFPTKTPVGTHYVQSKMPSKNMGGSRLTDTLGDRALPGVPWTMFFAEGGYALHGTYWHNNFGSPMSRGCINMRNQDAKWLFRWITPEWNLHAVDANDVGIWEVRGRGTRLEVVE